MSLKTSENLSPHSSFDSVMPEFHQGEHLSTSRASWSAPPSCKTTMSRQKPQKPFGCTKYHASMILLGATLFWRTNSPSQIVSSQVELTKIWVQVTKRRPIFLASSPTKTSLIAFEGRDENWLPTLSRCFFLRSKRWFAMQLFPPAIWKIHENPTGVCHLSTSQVGVLSPSRPGRCLTHEFLLGCSGMASFTDSLQKQLMLLSYLTDLCRLATGHKKMVTNCGNNSRYISILLFLDMQKSNVYMGVSKNRGTPNWMVYNGKPYQNAWFGGTTIFGNIHMSVAPPSSVRFSTAFVDRSPAASEQPVCVVGVVMWYLAEWLIQQLHDWFYVLIILILMTSRQWWPMRMLMAVIFSPLLVEILYSRFQRLRLILGLPA